MNFLTNSLPSHSVAGLTCQGHLPTLPVQGYACTLHSHLQAGSLKGTVISTALCKTEINRSTGYIDSTI